MMATATPIRNWRMPVDKVQLGSKFGDKDQFHPNPHRGVDFNGLPEGTPVKAVADGMKVVLNKALKDSPVLGNVVVLQVGSKFFGYCHLHEQSSLKVGTVVNAGDVVGHLGNTGSASAGAHLHFTLSDIVSGVFSGDVFDAYAFIKAAMAEDKKKKTAK
jgi:murein DD-endopeptidase MepM/ murein hydrolase activator NlpD